MIHANGVRQLQASLLVYLVCWNEFASLVQGARLTPSIDLSDEAFESPASANTSAIIHAPNRSSAQELETDVGLTTPSTVTALVEKDAHQQKFAWVQNLLSQETFAETVANTTAQVQEKVFWAWWQSEPGSIGQQVLDKMGAWGAKENGMSMEYTIALYARRATNGVTAMFNNTMDAIADHPTAAAVLGVAAIAGAVYYFSRDSSNQSADKQKEEELSAELEGQLAEADALDKKEEARLGKLSHIFNLVGAQRFLMEQVLKGKCSVHPAKTDSTASSLAAEKRMIMDLAEAITADAQDHDIVNKLQDNFKEIEAVIDNLGELNGKCTPSDVEVGPLSWFSADLIEQVYELMGEVDLLELPTEDEMQ